MASATPGRRPAVADPAKTPQRHASRSRTLTENRDPNLPRISSPSPKKPPSSTKPGKPLSSSLAAPPPPPPGRRFILVRRNSKKCPEGTIQDRRRAACESLRASQDGFFAARAAEPSPAKTTGEDDEEEEEEEEGQELVEEGEASPDASEVVGTAKVRKIRSRMMQDAMSSLPEQGCGRVLHLVKAFESILSISKSSEGGEAAERRGEANWALPGMQAPHPPPPRAALTCLSSSELFASQGDTRLCSSVDGSIDSLRLSLDSATTGGGRRSRRNSSDSAGSRRMKLGVTHQQPFKLRTEQRGRIKEEQFLKKVQEMLIEEAKRRIPQAQGLPLTTDEPECLVKPFVKEPTEPEDIVLHSDVRAVERQEFDNHVAERLAMAEQSRLERDRRQKMEEEEEIKRMRKELVPKAQKMPYFDKPFIPRRSERPRTVPREPRFHRVRSHKLCVPALDEIAEKRMSGLRY